MLKDKLLYFDLKIRTHKTDKIQRLCKRLGAKIELYYSNAVNIVITDTNDHLEKGKRKNGEEMLTNQSKRMKLMKEKIRKSIDNIPIVIEESFIEKVKRNGSKVKTISEVWSWLTQYYQALCETDICVESNIVSNDANKNTVALKCPAIKISDITGKYRPLFAENCYISPEMWEDAPIVDKKSRLSRKLSQKSINLKTWANSGTCLCCRKNYHDILHHLQSETHQNFVKNPNNFKEIDFVIESGPSIDDFFTERKKLWDKFLVKHIVGKENINASQKTITKSPQCSKCGKSSSSESQTSSGSSESSVSTYSKQNNENHNPNLPQRVSPSQISYSSKDLTKAFKHLQTHSIERSDSNNDEHDISFDFDSSVDDNEIDIHVDSVLMKLNSLSKSSFISSPDLLMNLEVDKGLLERNKNFQASDILEQRFDWCDSCTRNHLNVQQSSKDCKFPLPEPMELSKSDFIDTSRSMDCLIVVKRITDQEITNKVYDKEEQSSIEEPVRMRRSAAVSADRGIRNAIFLKTRSHRETVAALSDLSLNKETRFASSQDLLKMMHYPERQSRSRILKDRNS